MIASVFESHNADAHTAILSRNISLAFQFAKLGMGGGSSLLAGLSFAFGVPAPFILIRYGERLRMMSKHAQANA